MNKDYLKWWLIATLFALSVPVFAQKYSIHLAAFPEKINPSFFSFAGFEEVEYQQNTLFHQYTWGDFETLATAKNQLVILQKNPLLKGLTNLSILPPSKDFRIPTTDSSIDPALATTDFQLFTRAVFIHTASKSIQKIDVAILEEVLHILQQHPNLKLRIIAPTNPTSTAVTGPFTTVVKNFLLAQHIPAYRIKTIPNPLPQNGETKVTAKKQQVIMTLVDLKEEIVVDNFGKIPFMVKQENTVNNLEVID